MWKWVSNVKEFISSPSVKAWLKGALTNLKKILGSPEAIDFYITLISVALSMTIPEAKVLWDFLSKLIRKTETAFPEPKSGQKKYDMAVEEFKKAGLVKASGEKFSAFEFDFALHNALAQMKAETARAKLEK